MRRYAALRCAFLARVQTYVSHQKAARFASNLYLALFLPLRSGGAVKRRRYAALYFVALTPRATGNEALSIFYFGKGAAAR